MKDQKSLLIVDDDPYVLESVSSLLQEYGYQVTTCRSGLEALQRLQTSSFDVVLTDIKMPQITGIELLQSIHAYNRTDPRDPDDRLRGAGRCRRCDQAGRV